MEQKDPGKNHGSDSNLKLQAKSSNENVRAVVNFPFPAVPQGCEVASAEFRLFANGHKTGRTIQVSQLASAFTENGVTWSNQPGTTGAAASGASGSGWRSWDASAQVVAMYETGGLHGFLVRDANESGGGNDQQYNSRQSGNNRPTLIITYAPATTAEPTDTSAPEATASASQASFSFTGSVGVPPEEALRLTAARRPRRSSRSGLLNHAP